MQSSDDTANFFSSSAQNLQTGFSLGETAEKRGTFGKNAFMTEAHEPLVSGQNLDVDDDKMNLTTITEETTRKKK